MKKRILHSFVTKVSLLVVVMAALFVPLAPTASAAGINVFQNCGGSGGATGNSAGDGGVGGTGTNGTGTGSSGDGTVAGTASGDSICGATSPDDFNTLMKNIINTILVVLGIIAVIMIIIGGIRYTTSNGDSNQIKGAKDTILYAIIGIIVAIMAYAIVNFVLARLGGKS
jgi:hypothetical protein